MTHHDPELTPSPLGFVSRRSFLNVNFNSVLVEVALLYRRLIGSALVGGNAHGFGTPPASGKRPKNKKPYCTMVAHDCGFRYFAANHASVLTWRNDHYRLPFFFLLSAIATGFAVRFFESLLASLFFGRPFETRILGEIGSDCPNFASGLTGWTANPGAIYKAGTFPL